MGVSSCAVPGVIAKSGTCNGSGCKLQQLLLIIQARDVGAQQEQYSGHQASKHQRDNPAMQRRAVQRQFDVLLVPLLYA